MVVVVPVVAPGVVVVDVPVEAPGVGVVVVPVVAPGVGVVVVPVVAPGVGVVVVPVVVPVVAPVVVELRDVVVTVPFVAVVVACAAVRLPAESIVYLAVPDPPPHAVNITETLAIAESETARSDFLLNDAFNIKIFSLKLIRSDFTQISCKCLCKRMNFGN